MPELMYVASDGNELHGVCSTPPTALWTSARSRSGPCANRVLKEPRLQALQIDLLDCFMLLAWRFVFI